MAHKNKYIFKHTGDKKGRSTRVSPDNSPLRYLTYRRIVLDGTTPDVIADSGPEELSLICIKGEGTISVSGQDFAVRPYDALYLPPSTAFQVRATEFLDIVEGSAPSTKQGPPQYVPFESVKGDANLHLEAGKETYRRDVYKLIDANVDAERLLCGLTFGAEGNWTSWSPHEHADSREEIYLYIQMPKPAFGIQMIYDDLSDVDFIEPVFEDDAVVITHGFHPNVGIPGYGINFVWIMAGLTPDVDREWADMHWQEEFAGKY